MSSYREDKGIWDAIEAAPPIEREVLQASRLQTCVRRAAATTFYREQFERLGVRVDRVSGVADLRELPFTTKEDLRLHYPLGFLAVPRPEIARIHGSSGTTGKPTFVAYTKEDLQLWANLCARFLFAGGLRSHHLTQISFGFGLFTGGFGLHYGVERVGAGVIPAAAGNTRRQILLMQDLAPDALVCTPSYALNIAEVLRAEGVDPAHLPLRLGFFGGEPWTEDMRVRIEQELQIDAFNNYGLSEVMGPGVSGECIHKCGMHLQEDHFLVECLDPDTLEPVEEGAPGELVITSLSKQAMPILRYRTRDIACVDRTPCACGRTTARMSRVIGRSDDMLIVRGVNVFPSQIEEAILRVEGATPHYLIELSRPGTLDQVVVKVEVTPERFSDRMRDMHQLRDAIDREIQAITGVRVNVELVAPHSLERTEGKAKRVVDNR